MSRVALSACALLLFVRCVVGSEVGARDYTCVTDADCSDGFVCHRTRGVCDASTGGSAGGGDGGTSGGATAGGGTSGGATAGGSTAGGSTAGGSTAGGSTAGGSTAGGGTAGGGTAGGSTAGGAPNGTSCTLGTQCATALCVDGRCCTNACAGPCDRCNVPGLEGQCRAAPLGTVPSTACSGGYACNGTSAACPTTCTSDAGCVAARCAVDGVCLPKLHTFREPFDSLDASVWSVADPLVRVQNGQLLASSIANSGNYPAMSTVKRYDFTESSVSIELIDAGDQSLPTFEAYAASVCSVTAMNRCVALLANSGSIAIEQREGSTFSSPAGSATLGTWRFYRMRESAGRIYLEGSTDGGGYTVLGSMMTPFIDDYRDVIVWIGAGAYGPETVSSTAVYDNLNLP